MPQFDVAPYLSQAFWMLISFGFMYLLVSYLIMPMLEDVFEKRDTLIKTDLEAAERLNKQAETVIKEYDEFMLSADQQKAAMLKMAYEDLNRTSVKIEGEHDKKIRQKIKTTEKELQHLRERLHEQSDQIAEVVAQKLVDKLDAAEAKR
jgi:F-type H+-transporting ATPase subunit b